jgi:hypothetical protein
VLEAEDAVTLSQVDPFVDGISPTSSVGNAPSVGLPALAATATATQLDPTSLLRRLPLHPPASSRLGIAPALFNPVSPAPLLTMEQPAFVPARTGLASLAEAAAASSPGISATPAPPYPTNGLPSTMPPALPPANMVGAGLAGTRADVYGLSITLPPAASIGSAWVWAHRAVPPPLAHHR